MTDHLNSILGAMPSTLKMPIRSQMAAELEALGDRMARARYEQTAAAFVSHIAEQVRAFEAALDPESEVGAYLVNFGQALTVHVQEIRAIDPSLVVVTGLTDERRPVRLIQHITQISFMLLSVERLDPEEPRKPIGFMVEEQGNGHPAER